MKTAKIRLYVEQPLGQGQTIRLDGAQAHYLIGVMRRADGDRVRLFNGRDGEWEAELSEVRKRNCLATCQSQSAAQGAPADIWLLFAPLKKVRTDMVIEKATELGVARLQPVLTDFTNAERVRVDRLQAHVVEAAEQCGATYVPDVALPMKLSALLQGWDAARALIFCDESLAGTAAPDWPGAPAALLIGPEGGFSSDERARITAMEAAHPIALGPRILRAETAALAALTLWQSKMGDWA